MKLWISSKIDKRLSELGLLYSAVTRVHKSLGKLTGLTLVLLK